MVAVGIRELKERTSEVVRRVREQGESIDVTYRGRIVARLVPAGDQGVEAAQWDAIWAERTRLIKDIGAHWPEGVSAVDAVREQRRDL